jgi:AraC-like DNA-binding protein
LAGSNRTYVKQDIKALIGLSFRDWLKRARIDAARVQLSGEEPIAEIAHNVGFKSQAHFATLFKSELGVTPSEYRQSLSMKNSA